MSAAAEGTAHGFSIQGFRQPALRIMRSFGFGEATMLAHANYQPLVGRRGGQRYSHRQSFRSAKRRPNSLEILSTKASGEEPVILLNSFVKWAWS